MDILLSKLGAIIFSAGLAISAFFGFTPTQEPVDTLGGVQTVGGKTYTLYGGGIDSDDTSIELTSFTLPVSGAEITMSNFGSIGYITIEPGSATKQEFISFTGITANAGDTVTLTGVSRGLAPIYPYTASTTYAKSHAGGSIVVISNPPQLYNEAAFKGNNETITGQWTFENFPITPSSTPATATTTGTVELATGAEAASSTLNGDIATSFLALHTGIATSVAPTSGNVIPVTGDDGKLSGDFINTFNSTTTFNGFVAGIGSTTIRTYTSTSTYTKPTNLRHIIVEVQGAGGDGATDGAGGGGGGYLMKLIPASSLSATTSIVVGGAGASSGNTSFGSYTAGNGADASGSTGGSGGTATSGDININGQDGHSQSSGGAGGDAKLGFGGKTAVSLSSTGVTNGHSAGGYGGGGGGGAPASDGTPTGGGGGSGTQGIVIVTEYF